MNIVYFISMLCVSDDWVEVQTRDRASIVRWLRQLDHEGSSWTVLQADRNASDTEAAPNTMDITAEIMAEYGGEAMPASA